jgi:alpha-tubulin suppressor-like RCC1 family protein
MGQTHTLLISSETYNDTKGTFPRRGLVYGWGDNLVGQIGLGFAGPSPFNYNISSPAVLICPTEEVYLFDRRVDERPIVGLPLTWPNTDWIVPTCIVNQDVKGVLNGEWEVNTFVQYNPFMYENVVQVVSGSFHSLAVTDKGDLYAWGWNTDNQLGQGPVETRASIPYPTAVFFFRRKINANVVRLAAGFAHSAAVTEDGDLYTWGNNKYGQLGTGDYNTRSFPTLVKGFVDSSGAVYKVGDIACGLYHCLALTTTGQVWSFGSNSRGQLGTCAGPVTRTESLDLTCELTPVMNNAVFNTQPIPVLVDFLDITDYNGNVIGQPYVSKIACGAFHSMAIGSPCITALSEGTTQCPQFDLAEGDLYVWGHNRFGQLGTGVASEFTFQQTPTLVMAFQTAGTRCRREENADLTGCVPPQDFFRMGKRVTNVDAGSWHTLVFVEQKEQIGYRRQFVSVNRFFTFGNNEEGQLGHGDTLDRNYPTMVPTNYVKLHDLSGSFYQSMYTQGCLPSDWNPCQGNGLCFEQGVCECSSGYRGVDCSIVCDGGADSPCSGHGDPDMAKKIAAWRQDVINVTAGWKLLGFYEKLFEEWVCDADVKAHNDAISADPPIPIPKSRPQVFYGSVPGENSTNLLTRKPILPVPTFYHQKHCEDHCVPLQGKCTMRKKMNASSEDVLHMLELINASSTLGSLKTATRMIIEDWPITLFNQGLRSPHLYSYNARSEVLTPKTYGPRQGGVWWPSDILPMLEMFQNRSTCWRTYSCGSPFTPCEIIRGSVRITQGESALDVLQGCRDGWTARVHFQKRIEEIDQAWSNLEMENYQCDPQAVADEVGIRKEQVQFIWAVFERDVGNITRMLAEDFILEDPLSTPMNDPENQIPAVWKALSEGCQNTSIGQVKSGCMFDGSCMCAKGWTGPACDIMCAGGVDNPCSGNGVCRFDGLCECRRGWTGKDCSIECSGAAEDPLHFPCNNNGMCEGWYVDARTQYEYAPTDYEQAVYMSTGRGLSFYNLSTALATTGECTCHYGYRSDWGMSDCGVQCPGTAERYLDERGECYNNGVCNVTGKCECFEGYRNVSCNVECLGGHKIELGTGTVYSNECTSRPICDVYPQYSITTSDQRQVLCSEMDKFADDYSKDYSKVASGVTLRVYNGLCQYLDFTPPTVDRQFPVPKCPNDVWCDPTLPVAGPGGDCSTDSAVQTYCLEHKTRFMNFTGQYFNSTRENPGILDPLVGDPPSGCPDKQCKGIADYIEKMGYNQQEALRFAWAGPQPDRAPHHSVTMGHCYCLSGFRGANCSKTCPGAEMDPFNPTGDDRSFPVSFENTMWPRSEPGYPYPPLPGQMVHVDQVREGDPNSPLSMAIYGLDVPRGWDANNDNITEGVAARSLINICSARGYCEEDATCSCFLTDRGPHTNWTDVTGYRGEACEIECPGGAHSICSKNGICNENGECICFKGYRNDTCEVQCEGARDCDPARGCAGVCNYAGECGVEGICTCDATFKGPGCGKVCPPWTGKPQDECFGRGVCRYDEELDDAVCDCSIFYEGEACERIAGWVIFVLVFAILIFIAVCVHVIRRYLHSRMRQKRRARRDRRKVRRTQAAVGRLKNYKVTMPDAAALEAKGL